MYIAAENLQFEKAAGLRDKVQELQTSLKDKK
jgi:excinuclease UvrABC helicase subunit UvrB